MVNYDLTDVYLIKTKHKALIKTSVSSVSYFKQTFKNLIKKSKKKIYDEFRLNEYEIIYIESFKAYNKKDKNIIEEMLFNQVISKYNLDIKLIKENNELKQDKTFIITAKNEIYERYKQLIIKSNILK